MFNFNFFSFSKTLFIPGSILFSINTVIASSSDIYQHEEHDVPLTHKPKLLKILSVDGGGIRGIIPATLLARLEELTDKPIAKSFDVMAGTSTGGILTMGLNAGDENGIPLYSASKMVDIYTKKGSAIFQQSLGRKVASCMGLMSYKYNSEGLENISKELVGDQKLSDSITNTIVTTYEIERDEPYFFKSALAKIDKGRDFYMRDVVRSTSAAPVYFQPAQVKNLNGEIFSFIDGGVVLNNPTLSATIHGKNLFPTVKPDHYMVVSLGTGNMTRSIPYDKVKNAGGLNWVDKIIPLMMDGSSHVVDYQMSHVMPDIEGMKRYFRFQPIIPNDLSEMDNTNPENIKKLQIIAEKAAHNYFDGLLQVIAKGIKTSKKLSVDYNRKLSVNEQTISMPTITNNRKNSIFLDPIHSNEFEAILDLSSINSLPRSQKTKFNPRMTSINLGSLKEENSESEEKLIIEQNTQNDTDSDDSEESDD